MNRNQAKHALSYALVAVAAAAAAFLFIVVSGANLSSALSGFFTGILGTPYAICEVLVKAIPLTLAGLGVAIGFRSGFTNLGAEGQIYIGAIAATCVGLWFPNLPGIVMILLSMLAAFVTGGVWALIPGVLKVRFGISEVINTIMFNYIAINIVGILVQTVLKDPTYPYPVSPTLPESANLPVLISGTRLHAGIFLAIVFAVLVWILIFKTPYGFEMRAVGCNPRGCQCSGISVYKSVILSALLGGGLVGIAGMGEVAGLHHRLIEGISPNYGYLAVIVALLGRNHPAGVVVSAIGIAALQVGSLAMQRSAGVPTSIASVIMGVIVLLILARKTVFSRWLSESEKEVA